MFTYLLVAPESNALFFMSQIQYFVCFLLCWIFRAVEKHRGISLVNVFAGDRTTTTTTADRYRSLYTHSSSALIGGLTVGLVGALAFLFAVVIVCRRQNKRARTPTPPSSPAQDPSVLYHNNAVFMVPSVACMSPSLGYTKKGYTNMGYTSYVTLQTGPPNTLAAQPSEKTGPPNTLAAQPSGENGPPQTGPSETMA